MSLVNLNVGVCGVKLNNVDLGETDGGVKVSVKKNVEKQTVDRFGKTPVKIINNGDEVSIEANLAEYTNDNLAVALPGSSIQTGSLGEKLVFGSEAGDEISSNELVLHPINMGADTSKDWVIYKFVITGDLDIDYKNDSKKIIKLVGEAIVDDTKSDGNKLCHFGVSAIS
jgi:hypothetical protein